MTNTHRWCVLSLSLLVVCVLSGCVESESGPEISPLLTVTHTPNPVKAVATPDTNGMFVNYVWTFRTDVHNGLDVPVRIVRFGSSMDYNGVWTPSPSEPFTSDQFAEWYTAGDPAPGGWIQPGETATDTTNWTRNNAAVSPRCRWTYEAEDEQGTPYLAVEEIELYPYVSDAEPWSDGNPGALIPLTVSWEPTGGALPPGSQIRISRFGQSVDPLYAAYEVTDTSMPDPVIRAPGLYELSVVVPGQHTAELIVLLEDTEKRLDLIMREAPLADGDDMNVMPMICDADHAYLEELLQMNRRQAHESNALSRTYAKYTAVHGGDARGFRYDWEPMTAYVTERLSEPYPLEVRRLAALIMIQISPEPDAPTARLVAELLPADSFVWAADPGSAGNMAGRLVQALEHDMLADMADGHPDFYVRGFATGELGSMAADAGDLELSERCYRTIVADYASVRGMDYFQRALNPDKIVRVGNKLPAYSEPLLVGEGRVTNDTDAGRYRLIHFWASWCGHCVRDMESIHAAYERFHPAGLEIHSFTVDRQASDALEFQRDTWPMPWTNAYPQNTMMSEMVKDFEIVGIPYLVLVDPDGVVVAASKDLKGEALAATLARFLPQEHL